MLSPYIQQEPCQDECKYHNSLIICIIKSIQENTGHGNPIILIGLRFHNEKKKAEQGEPVDVTYRARQ